MTRLSINLQPMHEVLDGRQLNDLIRFGLLEQCRRRPDVIDHTVEGYTNRVA